MKKLLLLLVIILLASCAPQPQPTLVPPSRLESLDAALILDIVKPEDTKLACENIDAVLASDPFSPGPNLGITEFLKRYLLVGDVRSHTYGGWARKAAPSVIGQDWFRLLEIFTYNNRSHWEDASVLCWDSYEAELELMDSTMYRLALKDAAWSEDITSK